MGSAVSSPVDRTIAGLGDASQRLARLRLAYLSNLSPDKMALFEQTWAAIPAQQRRQIVRRLAEMTEDDVALDFGGIFQYCLRDRDEEVRRLAIEGLWESEEPSLIAPLIRLLETDGSARVQAAAAAALGRFAMMGELGRLRPGHAARVYQALLAAAGDESRPLDVRRRALEAVAPSGLPDVTAAITAAYRSASPGFRASAVYAMGRNCRRDWLPVLLRELDSPENEMRYEAAGACGELGEAEAVPHLIRLTDDANINVRLAAIQALGSVGGKSAREHLRRCLAGRGQAVRNAAEQALDKLQAEEAPFLFWGVK